MTRLSSIAGLALLLGLVTAADHKVLAGQKIQDAIDAASPGDKITVAAYTYKEQLTITKNGIKLVGQKGAMIIPPDIPVTNGCSDLTGAGLQAGICIGGDVNYVAGPLPDPDNGGEHRKVQSVNNYATDVQVKGFIVKDFAVNIAIVGGQNVEVRENTAIDSNRYGILTVGSKGTKIARNTVTSEDLRFIGICNDDQSDVAVTVNTISAMFIGLCVQTNGADVSHNIVSQCCIGAFVDPHVDGARLNHNKISDTNPICNFGLVSGIRIIGATNTNVQHNDISGITDYGFPDEGGPFDSNIGAGIAVYDNIVEAGGDGALATGNKIDFNDLSGNDQDFDVRAAGPNEIKHNSCATPASICGSQ